MSKIDDLHARRDTITVSGSSFSYAPLVISNIQVDDKDANWELTIQLKPEPKLIYEGVRQPTTDELIRALAPLNISIFWIYVFKVLCSVAEKVPTNEQET